MEKLKLRKIEWCAESYRDSKGWTQGPNPDLIISSLNHYFLKDKLQFSIHAIDLNYNTDNFPYENIKVENEIESSLNFNLENNYSNTYKVLGSLTITIPENI